jgi:hypothetical protein
MNCEKQRNFREAAALMDTPTKGHSILTAPVQPI